MTIDPFRWLRIAAYSIILWACVALLNRAQAQVAVTPYLTSQPQFFDNSGKPLASGCVFAYVAGTSTPQATYTDSTGSVANTNPIILNAGGFAPSAIWVSALSYKFVVKSTGGTNCASGTQIRSEDNISPNKLVNAVVTNPTGTQSITGTLLAKIMNGVLYAAPYGIVADGTTDDAAAVNSAITAAVTANVGIIQLPCGQIKVNSAINLTNRSNLAFRGCGSNQDYGGLYPTQITQILCNTGGVCLDATGSSFLRLERFSLRASTSYSNMSYVGILMGRDHATAASDYSEFNELDQVYVYFDTKTSGTTSRGTVPLYNVGAEHLTVTQSKFSGDEPVAMAATNVLSVTSPYQTLATGSPASMTTVQFNTVSVTVQTNQGYELWDAQDIQFINCHAIQGSAGQYSFGLNGTTNKIDITGQYENLPGFMTIAGLPADHLRIDVGVVAATFTYHINVNAGAAITNSYFKIRTASGTARAMFNVPGAATLRGSYVDLGTLAATLGNNTNLTVSDSIIQADGLTNAQVAFNSGSSYLLQSNSGTQFVGGIGAFYVQNSTNLPAATTANFHIAGNFGSPILGKMYVGDGSGWQLDLAKRTGSADTTLFSFKDNGNFLGASGSAISGFDSISSKQNINLRNNVALVNGANVDVALGGNSFVKVTGPTGVYSISGFAGGTDGRVLYLYNSVAFAMTITNEGAGSVAANRITTLTGADVTLRAGTSFASFIYDSAASRWILMSTN